jgi:preprotein translocase subunit YajC
MSLHKPTLMTSIVIVVVLFVVYHFMLGRKKG